MVRRLLAEIYCRDRPLAVTGWIQIAILLVVLAVAPFDDRVILGLNPWIKPIKFLLSIVVFVWTVAWILPFLKVPRWMTGVVSWGISLTMIVEITCVVMQSVRGVRSHFNFDSAFDGCVVWVFAAAYAAVGWALYHQAISGRPLLAL